MAGQAEGVGPVAGSRLFPTRVVELGGVPVRLSAADRPRAEAMAGLLDGLEDHPGPPVAEVAFGLDPPAVPDGAPDRTYPDLAVWHAEGVLTLRHNSGLAARADGCRLEVGGDAPAADLRLAFRRLFHPGATFLLAHRDRYVVHAAAVVAGDRALLVLGSTGRGKSTLALAAWHAGWEVLGDDLAVLEGEPGSLCVSGIPRPVSVPADVLGETVPDGRPTAGGRRPRVELPADRLHRGWWPVAGVVAAGHARTAGGSLRRLPGAAVLELLVGSFFAAGDPELLRGFFPRAAAAARLPAWRLCHAPDPSARVAAGARLLDRVLDRLPEAR